MTRARPTTRGPAGGRNTRLEALARAWVPGVAPALRLVRASFSDIFDLSKAEAGKMVLETVDFDVRSVADEAAGMLADQGEAKGLGLTVAVDPDVPLAVAGDPARVRQVLLNLLGNAVKFTRAGEVGLRVRVSAHPSGASRLCFEVHDTGVGIPDETLAHLFQSFEQADASTTRRYGGTGMGLAISRQLVALMGGRIGVDSEVGTGSTFWFAVPLRPATGRMPVPPPGPGAASLVAIPQPGVLPHAAGPYRPPSASS
ncbi:MAG: ATP-binding protein [Actinomycetota bacterium]